MALDFIATAFVTLFVIIDPIGMVPIFLGLTPGQSSERRRRTAQKAVAVAAVTLIVFALAGEAFLHFLGITLPALRIAGGLLLFLLSIDMVFARQSGIRSMTDSESHEAEGRGDVAVFPLAVPLIAGPGALTSILLLLSRVAGDIIMQAVVIALMLIVLGITLVAFFLAARLMTLLGVTGVNVISRVLGIVLAALAVQYMLDGLSAVF